MWNEAAETELDIDRRRFGGVGPGEKVLSAVEITELDGNGDLASGFCDGVGEVIEGPFVAKLE